MIFRNNLRFKRNFAIPNKPFLCYIYLSHLHSDSTVSTGINALACTTLEDFIKPAFPRLSERQSVIISKILGKNRTNTRTSISVSLICIY